MNTLDHGARGRRLAALVTASVMSLSVLSAVLLLFAGVEPDAPPLLVAVHCDGTSAPGCASAGGGGMPHSDGFDPSQPHDPVEPESVAFR